MTSILARLTVLVVIALVLPISAAAQASLPLGGAQQAKVSSNASTEYTFVAKSAGLLAVAVQGEGDLAFQVADEDGQTLPDGNVDRDMNGSEGTEMVSMSITEPGTYKIRVRVQGGTTSSAFQIGGAWLAFPAFARPTADPDRRPKQAQSIPIGKAHEDGLNSDQGDHWDWFVMKAAEAGTLAIVTRRVGDGDADLALEVYTDGDFSKPSDRSDQDLQGNNANESVTVNVTAGQLVHVKVAGTFSRAITKYRLSSSLIP